MNVGSASAHKADDKLSMNLEQVLYFRYSVTDKSCG